MKKLLFGALLVTLVAATPARAQGDRPVHLNIGGGFTMPISDVKDRFGTGPGFSNSITALLKSSVLTSGRTFRCTRPAEVTVGVKLRRTPNSLNWTETPMFP